MTRVVIVGAGSFGRELFGWIRRSRWLDESSHVVFVDDVASELQPFPALFERYAGTVAAFEPLPDDRLLLAISSPTAKRAVVDVLVRRGGTFATFVHDSVLISDEVAIGTGSVICPNVVVSCYASIGSYVTLNLATTIGHDAVIGDFCSLMSHVDITGKVRLGSGVFAGSHATVLPGVSVGEGAVIGAGSAVIRRVSAGSTVTGVPAQRLFGSDKASLSGKH